MTAFGKDQLYAQVLLSANAFIDGWTIGYVFFSLHLFLPGYLVWRAGFIPRLLGVLLIVSSFTYLVDNVAELLLTTYENYATIFTVLAVPSFLGKFLLIMWLLVWVGSLFWYWIIIIVHTNQAEGIRGTR